MSSRMLPNWLEGYLVYTNSSESPEMFHLWCGIIAIAGALRRKVWFAHGYFDVYPNMYNVIVSPAGRCKKSTAMRMGRDILSRVPGLHFTVDSTSRERLILDMSQANSDGHSSMTAYSSEFSSLLTTSGMDMVMFLTDIFDSPNEWTHRTKGGGTQTIKNAWLNLQAGTTTDWLNKAMPLDTIGTGLNSRVVYVYQDTPRIRPAIPTLSTAQQAVKEMLIADLTAISTLSGEFVMDPETYKHYNEVWYPNHLTGVGRQDDPKMASYYERKHIHLIKLCMIVSASFGNDLIISRNHFEHALTLLADVEKRMPEVFVGMGKNPLQGDMTAILADMLGRKEGVTRADLIRKFSSSVRLEELDEIISTLISMGKVRMEGNRYYLIAPHE